MNIKDLPEIESQTVEFKTSFSDEVIISLVAFSNAIGGSVFVGVADNGEVKGVSIGKETIANWITEIRNKTAPIIIPHIETLEIKDKTIVIFKVFEYPIKPVSIKGRYYKRTKNTNQLLTTTEVVNLHLQSINSSWDAYPDPLHTLEDISLEKVQAAIERMRENDLTITESPLSFLLKFNLLRDDRPTNAAYLLFKNNHSFLTTIELGRFQDNISIKDSARTQSDIIMQVNEVIEFVKKHINLEIIISGKAQNTQKWQYPLEAIREIVLNMIIHRDYRSSADSIVKIFNNKIEFFNPGNLPQDITVEDLLSNNYKSNPRNKSVADFFKNLGLIEKYGSGIVRIISYLKEANLPEPKFSNISGGFQVTLYSSENLLKEEIDNVTNDTGNVTNNVTDDIDNVTDDVTDRTDNVTDVTDRTDNVTDNVTDDVTDVTDDVTDDVIDNVTDVTDRATKILSLIRDNKQITVSDIARHLEVTKRTILRDIEKMKNSNAIKRIGSEKSGYWFINNLIGID